MEVPYEVAYLIDWFEDMCMGRTSSGFGINPLTWVDIQSWSNLTKYELHHWEVSAIKYLDAIYITESKKRAKQAAKDAKTKK